MSTHYRIETDVRVVVHVIEGKVTGVEALDGWSEPFIEAEEDDGTTRELVPDVFSRWEDTEESIALAPLTGKWRVEIA